MKPETFLTVTAGDLAQILAVTIPAVDAYAFPALYCVHLAGGETGLTATATDRHVAVQARCDTGDAAGEIEPTLINLPDAKLLRKHLRGVEQNGLVEIRTAAGRIFVTTHRVRLRFTSLDMQGWPGEVLARIFAATPGEASPQWDLSPHVVRIVGRIMRRLPNTRPRTRWSRIVIKPRGPLEQAPIRIDVADWLAIIVMPLRRDVERHEEE